MNIKVVRFIQKVFFIESVASNVKHMEVQLRGEVKNKLDNVQSVLLAALEKASKSLQDIKNDVKQGIVWKVGWLFQQSLLRICIFRKSMHEIWKKGYSILIKKLTCMRNKNIIKWTYQIIFLSCLDSWQCDINFWRFKIVTICAIIYQNLFNLHLYCFLRAPKIHLKIMSSPFRFFGHWFLPKVSSFESSIVTAIESENMTLS